MIDKRIILIAVCTLLFGLGSAQGADDPKIEPPPAQNMIRNAPLPALAATHVWDAVVVRIENNSLGIYTRLDPTEGQRGIVVPELTGTCTVSVQLRRSTTRPADRTVPYRPAIFLFTHLISANSATTVQINPINVQIEHETESANDVRQVLLVQSAPGQDADEPAVRLTLSGGGQPNVVFTAPDFMTLRRQYPAETTKYLEPLFRELHADGIAFSPDSKLAWQVFAQEAQPDPGIAKEVTPILKRLDSDDFHERDAAAETLKKLGEPAAVVLWKMDRSGFSAEQNSRIDGFLSDYQPGTEADVTRLRNDPSFLMECLYDTDDFVVNTALAQLTHVTGHPISFDPALRGDARREAVNALRDKLVPTTLPAVTGN